MLYPSPRYSTHFESCETESQWQEVKTCSSAEEYFFHLRGVSISKSLSLTVTCHKTIAALTKLKIIQPLYIHALARTIIATIPQIILPLAKIIAEYTPIVLPPKN